MAVILTKIVAVLLLSKPVFLDKGYISEVQMNMKVQCVGSSKEVFTVKSEMQCTHHCLRQRCNLLNYNAKRGEKDNCEVMKNVGTCSELSSQSDWRLMNFVVELQPTVQLNIMIASYGKSDSGFSLKNVIKVNGIDTGAAGRGFNVVVISSDNGKILGVGNFDTHGKQSASSSMINFINSYPDGSVLCFAITDSAAGKLTQGAKDYLVLLGSVGASSISLRSSLAMLTAKGSQLPDWFEEVFATRGNGPSIIETSLRI